MRETLRQAWELDDAEKAERLIRNLARRLEQMAPGVSASILEGIDEMLTVIRLGLPLELRRSLACTNIIENMMGTIRRVCRNVKRWRDASMALRWTGAAMQEAAKGFRRLKAHKQLPVLRAALAAHQAKHTMKNSNIEDRALAGLCVDVASAFSEQCWGNYEKDTCSRYSCGFHWRGRCRANAADFYGGSLKDAPAFVPPPTWSGFYIGGHVGGAWSELQNSWDSLILIPGGWLVPSWKRASTDALFGGGTVGYNYQTGAFVIGVEADFGAMDSSGTSANDAFWIKQDAKLYADVTGRLGYALGPALIYAKGGWAYLDNPITVGFSDYFGGNHTFNGTSCTAGRSAAVLNTSSRRPGERKAEYQFFDFGEQTYPYVFNDVEHQRQSTALTLDTFKVGLNYHFNNIYAPAE